MTLSKIQASQLSNTLIQLIWSTDDTLPLAPWEISRDVDGAGLAARATLAAPETLTFFDTITLVVGETYQYEVTDPTSAEVGLSNLITVQDLEEPFTHGTVDYLATVARYTTVDAVKQRLAIVDDVTRDDQILSCIIASELALDVFMHRSFPDTGDNPQIPGIPDGITQAALQTAIATWKEADAPTGSSGSDSFMGALSVSETTRTMIQQSAILIGFRTGFGVG